MGIPRDSRGQILTAAEAIFAVKGFHLTTMEEIAERAGVAKGTVFYNFGSKAELFATVLKDGMQYLMDAMRKEVETDRPPLEQIASIIDLHVSTLLENPGFIAIFSRELSGGLEDGVQQTIHRTRQEYVAFVAALLQEAKRYGIVKALDCNMLASTLFDVALSVCAYAVENNGAGGVPAISQFLKTFVIEGIASR